MSSTSADDLLALLQPLCPGLEREMLVDLLCPDETPEGCSWHDGEVRLASSFAVYAPEARKNGGLTPVYTPSAEAVYEAVEMLAGDGWLVTRWHDACVYRGPDPIGEPLPPVSRDGIRASVEKHWAKHDGGTAGDLGVVVMYELALTYASTHRRFLAALENWELDLYKSEDGKGLSEGVVLLNELWGARARLRDWLNPLNIAGLNRDIGKAWLPVSDHVEVKAVDKRVDDALAELAKLGDTLRGSFHLLHVKMSEAHREHHERMARRIEFVAAVFLVPTLIVGFFGANTWVPGEHRHWGLTLMAILMAVLTGIVIAALLLTRRRSLQKGSGLGHATRVTSRARR